MKSGKIGIISFVFFIITVVACTKAITPSATEVKAKNKYDPAAFDYVFVEALKQKLLGNAGDALKYLEQCIKINPESDAAYYEMAQIVIGNGDLKNGTRYAQKALSFDQKNLWYLTMLASLYYQDKDIDSSLIYYEDAVKLFPEDENLQLTLGNLYSENKQYEKANLIFQSFDKKYGVNETSTLASVKNLMAEGKFGEAVEKARLLIRDNPDNVLYGALLADIYKENGDPAKAEEVYEELLIKDPESPQVQLAYCDFLIDEKQYDNLFSFLNKVILNKNVERQNKITLMVRLIDTPEIVGKWSDKLSVALMVLEANYSNDNIIPLLRPELLSRENKFKEAAARLEELIKSNPDNYYAWEKLLVIYMQLKDYDKLMKRGEECATLFNTSFPAKLLYANAALETGKYPVALEELKKAEILAADNKDSLVQVLSMRADVYYRMKDFSKAFESFDTALIINKNDLTLLNNYAYYLAEQNVRLKDAEEMAGAVIEKEKNNTTFLDTYGWVLYKRGKLKEAARVMESIINSGDKSDAVWYEHYGYILKKMKRCNEAVINWKIALKIDSTKTELLKEIENCEK